MEGKFVFSAAQIPFETGGFHFCPLVPVCRVDGALVDARVEFPNSGLCWFMLRDVRFQGLTPGQLVVGPVEPTKDYQTSAPEKHWFQLKVDSAQLAGTSDTVLEVLDAGPEHSDGPRDLISPQREIFVDHRPTELALVGLGQKVYGPFRVKASRNEGRVDQAWRVTLERTSTNKVWQVDKAALVKGGGLQDNVEVRVSLEDAPPSKAAHTRVIRYVLLPWQRFQKLRQASGAEIELLTDAEILGRVARDHLKPKSKRQQLQQLLKELDSTLQHVPEPLSKTALLTATHLSDNLTASERLGDELIDALLASGALKDRIDGLREKRFEEYIEARAAEANSRISERVQQVQKHYDTLSAQLNELKETIKKEQDEKRTAVDEEIRKLREKADAKIEEQRQLLDRQRDALHREQKTLAQAVELATARFSEGRKELVADLLALLPALQTTGMLPQVEAQAPPTNHEKPVVDWALPKAFTVSRAEPGQHLEERTFFERFARHVDASGFRYREMDLKAFHLSVKCTDLTVLAGLSGVGKSSLVRLYSEALAGEDLAARERLLTIDVSPSWTEPQDILGSANLLDRRFEPAACGLFNHIVAAGREYTQSGLNSGMVLISLDEMNLAQVEHYFAGFIQALERPVPRDLAVFDRSALRPDDPLRDYYRLPLPPTLRFVGTVNFDETTRSLSQRLKDRAAILELSGERHAGLQELKGSNVLVVEGPSVRLSDVHTWLAGDGQWPVSVATLFDDLNPLLLRLGAPITARRASAIHHLFAAGIPLLTPEQVLDVVLTTRVLPLLRGLNRRSAQEDAEIVLELLAAAPGGCRNSCTQLSSMLAQERDVWQEVVEDE